ERQSAGDTWMRTALPRMLSDQLAGDRVRIAPNEAAIRMPIELQLAETTTFAPETASRIGRYAKADLILCGSFVALGDDDTDDFELTARVQEVRSGEVIAVASAVGSKARLFALVQNVAADLRQQLGLAAPPIEEQRRVEHLSVPANLEAARLYARGVEELHRYNVVAARDLLLGAAKADPKYAPTRRALCDVWTKLANNTRAREEATLALQLAADLPRAQQLEIEALHAQTHRQFAKAIEIRRTLVNFYPENVEYALDLVSTLFAAQKLPEALEAVRALRTKNLAPEDPRVDFAEANVHLEIGSWADALRLADLAASRLRNGGSQVLLARSLSVKATALQRKGDDRWRQAMEECLSISRKAGFSAGAWRALQTLAIGYADDEQPEKAIPLLLAAEREALRAGDTRLVLGSIGNLAYAYSAAGRWEEAKRVAERALPLARAAADASNESILLNMLAHRVLGVGELEEAKRLSEEALRGATAMARKSGIAVNLATLGRIAFIRGRLDEARAKLGESLKIFSEIAATRGVASVSAVLARVAFEEGKLAEARNIIAGIDSIDARLLLARIDIEQGRPRQALTRLANDTTSAEAQALRALAASRLGDADEAGRLAAESLRLVKPSLLYHDLMSLRIDAARAAGAVDRLDDVARDASRTGDVLAALSARAARCELTHAGCREVAREARAHGLLRLARRGAASGAQPLAVMVPSGNPASRSRE
ncbi:MAG TPA: HrpB1 family type III secretion system apparatus protein, partial [Thermoanaerobaculia bacterium]|nr:HrpB1 family type III secretion system apparatus protein [Thermoanaerobaculia bacterium]